VRINTSAVKQREANNENLFNIYVIELTIYNKLIYLLKVKITFNIKNSMYLYYISPADCYKNIKTAYS